MNRVIPYRPLARRMNEQQVLDAIFERGPLSRVQVAAHIGLSKPTVSSIVDDLLHAGLIKADGRTSGHIGRTAVLYRVDERVGFAIGVDVGGTKISAAIADLYGRVLAELETPTDAGSTEALVRQLRTLPRELAERAGVPWASVAAVSLGVPGTVDRASGRIGLAFNIPDLTGVDLGARIGDESDAVVVLNNDVNLAAVGERWQGLARHTDTFAFLAIGTGVGMGLMLGGELYEGTGGAAGEVGYAAIGGDPAHPDNRRRGAFEEAASGRAIVRRLRERLAGGAPSELNENATAAEVFDAAATGDPVATELVLEEADVVARGIVTVSAVLAPEMVVLGGGIGANRLLLEPVRDAVRRMSLSPPDIVCSALGSRAALVGALAVGLEEARRAVLAGPANRAHAAGKDLSPTHVPPAISGSPARRDERDDDTARGIERGRSEERPTRGEEQR